MPGHDAITVRWAEPGDRDAIADLVQQTKRHYGEEQARNAELEAAVSGWLEKRAGHALFAIAFTGSRPAGYASVAVTPPAMGVAAALYMKELFVSPEMRGHGIGRCLLTFLAEYCLSENIERIDLTTATDNSAGIRFYEREGATVQQQKIALRFDNESLHRLANSEK
jgi:GNAT superfamily N-acetyltransferase